MLSDGLGWDVVPVTIAPRPTVRSAKVPCNGSSSTTPRSTTSRCFPDHEDRFRQFAVFDILANNTDRKGGHCLHDLANEVIVGIDHGLTFHPQWKLRTVIWDFADELDPGRTRGRRRPSDLGAGDR